MAGEADKTTLPVPVIPYEVPHAVPVELAIPAPGYTILPAPPFAKTKAVVASCVVLVPRVAVGAVGVPVKAGETDNDKTVPVPVVVYDVPHAVPVELGIPAPGYTMAKGVCQVATTPEVAVKT
jgi:hypothetical protein